MTRVTSLTSPSPSDSVAPGGAGDLAACTTRYRIAVAMGHPPRCGTPDGAQEIEAMRKQGDMGEMPGASHLLEERVDSLLNFKSFFFLEGCGKPLSF